MTVPVSPSAGTASGKKMLSAVPALVLQWHPTKNGSLVPSDASAGSSQKAWWLCELGHSWEAVISSRTKGNGCPYCANRIVLPGFNDLATLYPELAKQWHPTKNESLGPHQILAKSTLKVWWRCTDHPDHEWQAPPSNRIRGTGCPFCANRIVLRGFNDLASRYPELAAQWHPSRNGELTPDQIVFSTKKAVWWQCKTNPQHTWSAAPAARIHGKTGCPVCKGRKVVAGSNDLRSLRPDLIAQWDTEKNVAGSINCPSCSNHVSAMEEQVREFVRQCIPDHELVFNTRKIIAPKELDIYIPSKRIAIEFNGLFWHSEAAGKDKDYHRAKWEAAFAKGVQLITVWEDDWRDRIDVVKRMLARKLGASSLPVVAARKTRAGLIDHNAAAAFLESHHIQGFVSGSHYLGLRAVDNDDLVAVMVLRSQGEDLLLARFATSVRVPGGQSKLVRFVERSLEYRNLITFADLEVSDGNLYEATGFVKSGELAPDYKYIFDGSRQHKFGFRIERFRKDDALLFEDGLSERELALLNGIPRVWDAGKVRYIKPHPKS